MHCGSAEPFWHTHGFTCGPAITGPPIGWFTIVAPAPARGRGSVLEPNGKARDETLVAAVRAQRELVVTSRLAERTFTFDGSAPRLQVRQRPGSI